MNEKSTALWQIRNEVYPITPIPLECIVERIATIERFFVHLTRSDSFAEIAEPSPGHYDYASAASGKMTVAKWRETRFTKCFPMLSAQVVDNDGRVLADDEMISAARAAGKRSCEWDKDLVLDVTVWSNEKPHDDDETLLNALASTLAEFRFLQACAVLPPKGIWKHFGRCELKVKTKPLHLRRYERGVIVRLLEETIKEPGFECDVSQTFHSSIDPPQQAFRSQNLNEILNH